MATLNIINRFELELASGTIEGHQGVDTIAQDTLFAVATTVVSYSDAYFQVASQGALDLWTSSDAFSDWVRGWIKSDVDDVYIQMVTGTGSHAVKLKKNEPYWLPGLVVNSHWGTTDLVYGAISDESLTKIRAVNANASEANVRIFLAEVS